MMSQIQHTSAGFIRVSFFIDVTIEFKVKAEYEQKEYEKACEKYKQATKIQPDFAYAYIGWGNALTCIIHEDFGKSSKALTRILSYKKRYKQATEPILFQQTLFIAVCLHQLEDILALDDQTKS